MNVGPVHAPPWQNGPGQDRTAAHQGPVRPCVTGGLTGDRSARKPPEDQRLPTIRCAEGPARAPSRGTVSCWWSPALSVHTAGTPAHPRCGWRRRLPRVACRAQPPHGPVRDGFELLRAQVPVEGGVPLGGRLRVLLRTGRAWCRSGAVGPGLLRRAGRASGQLRVKCQGTASTAPGPGRCGHWPPPPRGEDNNFIISRNYLVNTKTCVLLGCFPPKLLMKARV